MYPVIFWEWLLFNLISIEIMKYCINFRDKHTEAILNLKEKTLIDKEKLTIDILLLIT